MLLNNTAYIPYLHYTHLTLDVKCYLCYIVDMSKYNLPKHYLSYSAYALWKSSKEGFRKRYYLNEKPFETKETLFGKATDLHLDNGGTIEGVLTYSHPQHRIEVEYKGLPLLGYLDALNMEDLRILERKTGHKNPKGKVPWDKVKVQKHVQLVWYSALVELKYGKVHPEVILQWLETDFVAKTMEFDGHILSAPKKDLVLTGRVETFKRKVAKWERVKLLKEMLTVAHEISDDYTEFVRSRKNQ